MVGRRWERNSSRDNSIRSKLLISLLEDSIQSVKFSRHRIPDIESEDNVAAGGVEPVASEESPPSQDATPSPVVDNSPVAPSVDPNKYSPTPYIFRIPVGPQTKEIKHSYAKCPPFYLQLDHTLAVIWCLFSKQPSSKPLGITQMQWALNFLKNIRHANGEQPKDITLCIQAIQDQLLEAYAALVNELIEEEEEENDAGASKSTTSSKQGRCNTQTCGKLGSTPSVPASDASSTKAKDVQSDVIITNLPFSVNYMEMMKSSPNAPSNIGRTQTSSLTVEQIKEEIAQLQQAGTILSAEPDGATQGKSDMLGFLIAWRQEQLEKVQAELKRLHSIEDFIENVDVQLPDKKAQKKVIIKEPSDEKFCGLWSKKKRE